MKYLLIISLQFLLLGCSGSSSISPNELLGKWLSNCYEFTDADDGFFIAYVIDESKFTESGLYITNSTSYTDINCTMPDGNTDIYNDTYVLGGSITSTDGSPVKLITVTSSNPFIPLTFTYDAVYRVTGVELNFGEFTSGVTPSLDYTITYIRQ